MRARSYRHLGALAAAVGLFLSLAGPAPGSVGGCDEEIMLVNGPDLCFELRALLCARARVRENQTDEQEIECLLDAQSGCAGTPPEFCLDGSRPSQGAAEICLDALSDGRTVDERIGLEDFPECDLCP